MPRARPAAAAADFVPIEQRIDWRLPTAGNGSRARSLCRGVVAQLWQGETMTAHACRRLATELPDELAALMVRQQHDEQAHAAAYARYLRLTGGPAPPDAAFVAVLDEAAELREPAARLLAFHVVLEEAALALQRCLARVAPCPLLRAVNREVARDEARHVAFGRRTLPALLARLPVSAHAVVATRVDGLRRRVVRGVAGACPVWLDGPLLERCARRPRLLADLLPGGERG